MPFGLINYDALVYGSGAVRAGGSGKAPDGSDPEERVSKYIAQLVGKYADYQTDLNKSGLRYYAEQLQTQIELDGIWQDSMVQLQEVASGDAKAKLDAAVTIHGNMLEGFRNLDQQNRAIVGRVVGNARGIKDSLPGATNEVVLEQLARDPNTFRLFEDTPALPDSLDGLKEALYGSQAWDAERNRWKSFRELFPEGGHATLLANMMQLEANAESTRRRLDVAHGVADDLGKAAAGAQADFAAGRAVDVDSMLARTKNAVQAQPDVLGGKSLKDVEAELAEIKKTDETAELMLDEIDRLRKEAAGPQGINKREQVGLIVGSPKFQRWARQRDLHLGKSEIAETVDPKTGVKIRKVVNYEEGRDDLRAIVKYRREQRHPPEHALHRRGTGLVGRAIVSETTPAMVDHYRLPTVAGMEDMTGKFARIASTGPGGEVIQTYLSPEQVDKMLVANGQAGIVGKGTPEVFFGMDATKAPVVKVIKGAKGEKAVYYSMGSDDKLHLISGEPPKVEESAWSPIAAKGENGKPVRYLSGAGLRDGAAKDVIQGVVVNSDEERAMLLGKSDERAATLDRLGVELSDEAPSRGFAVLGEIQGTWAGDPDGMVRLGTETGSITLGAPGSGQKVLRVEVIGLHERKGLLGAQFRSRKGEELLESWQTRAPGAAPGELDIITGVQVVDARPKVGVEPEQLGALGNIVGTMAARSDRAQSLDERVEERIQAKVAAREAAQAETPEAETAAKEVLRQRAAETEEGKAIQQQRLERIKAKRATEPSVAEPTTAAEEAATAPVTAAQAIRQGRAARIRGRRAEKAEAQVAAERAEVEAAKEKPVGAAPAVPAEEVEGIKTMVRKRHAEAAAGGEKKPFLGGLVEKIKAKLKAAPAEAAKPAEVKPAEAKPPTEKAGTSEVTPTSGETKVDLKTFGERIRQFAAEREAKKARRKEVEEAGIMGETEPHAATTTSASP